jgi:16S rRNA G966 N2-methylase RsmD
MNFLLIKEQTMDYQAIAKLADKVRQNVSKVIIGKEEQFDLIFADPPYQLATLATIPDLIFEHDLLAEGGIFVLEHGKNHDFSQHPRAIDHRVYGSVNFTLFR